MKQVDPGSFEPLPALLGGEMGGIVMHPTISANPPPRPPIVVVCDVLITDGGDRIVTDGGLGICVGTLGADMADIRIKDLPALVTPTGAEFIASDIAVGGTRKSLLSDLATYVASTLPIPTDFVFQPSGNAGGNVYTTWAALFAAASAGPNGVTKRIYLDGQFTLGVVDIPAGTWFFGGPYELIGIVNNSFGRPMVQFLDGCEFPSWPILIATMKIDDQNTTDPLFTTDLIPAPSLEIWFRNVNVLTDAGLPFLNVTTTEATEPRIILDRSEVIPVFVDDLLFGGTVVVITTNGSYLPSNTIAATQAFVITDASSVASVEHVATASVTFHSTWSSQSTFVFDPNTNPYVQANAFATWVELQAHVATVKGAITIVFVRDCTVTDTTYDHVSQVVRWVGGGNDAGGGSRPKVTCGAGQHIRGLRRVEHLELRHGNSGATSGMLITPLTMDWQYDFVDTKLNATGTSPIVFHNQIGELKIRLFEGSSVTSDSGNAAIRANAPAGALTVEGFDDSFANSNTIATDVATPAFMTTVDPASDISGQATLLGAVTSSLEPRSDLVGYITSIDAASWAVSDPVTVKEAIARLAVAVQGLLGGPIP